MTFWGVELWDAAVLFARLSALVMLMPGIGEAPVPANVRLLIALTLTAILTPALAPVLPPEPATFGAAATVIVSETIVGLMLGGAARLLMSTLNTAGQIIGIETGLAFAQTADPTQEQGAQILAAFLALLGAALIFATDTHHLFIRGVVQSYDMFAAGAGVDPGDASALAVALLGKSFLIAIQIAAPVILAGLVFRAGLGVLSKLVPQIQVFFVTVELSLLGGFAILALSLSIGVLVWLDHLQQFARTFG